MCPNGHNVLGAMIHECITHSLNGELLAVFLQCVQSRYKLSNMCGKYVCTMLIVLIRQLDRTSTDSSFKLLIILGNHF